MRVSPAPRMFARRAAGVASAGCLLTVVAFVFDAAPLFVPGLALTLIGVLTPGWVWLAARGARARRHLQAERVVEGEALEAIVEVRRGWLGLGGGGRFVVVDPFTGSRLDLSGPLSGSRSGRTSNIRVVAHFGRRGLHQLAAPSLIVGDALDLARVQVGASDATQQLLVLPRTETVRWLAAGRGRRLAMSDGDASSEAMAAVDLDGLRPYRPGTPASRIHWPAVARGAGLLERRLQADGDTRPLVVLDARTPAPSGDGAASGERPATADGAAPGDGAATELLDAAVRAAASLVLELARGGGCGLLLPGEQRPTTIDRELSAWPGAYARLAMVAGGADSRAPALGPAAGHRGPIIYVAACPVARLAALLAAPVAGLTVLVVPDRTLAGGRPRGIRANMVPMLEVSGCRGFTIGAGRGARPARHAASAA